MEYVTFSFVGISPLICHNPGRGSMQRAGDGKVGRKQVPTAEVEAERGLYLLPDGRYYHPAEAFRNAALSAGAGRRLGRVGAARVLQGTLFNVGEEAVLRCPESGEPLQEYQVDVRRCVVQHNGVTRARPRFDTWMTTVEFEIDTTGVTVEAVLDLLQIAGRTIGVGDYRPERKGPFGRFTASLVDGVEEVTP